MSWRARIVSSGLSAAYAALHMRRPQVAGLREAIEVMEQEAAATHGRPVRYQVQSNGREVVLLAVPLG